MCGIVGYVGKKEACGILIEGLKRLEYRGYDSAGICVQHDGGLRICKDAGRVGVLESCALADTGISSGTIGIAHTRWATHGQPTQANAHPHTDQSGRIALVHNGIIENYATLKQFLVNKGRTFASETDTEVLAQLIGEFYHDGYHPLEQAVRAALAEGDVRRRTAQDRRRPARKPADHRRRHR